MKFLILVWCLCFIFYKSSAIPQDCSIDTILKGTPIILRPLGDDFIISDLRNTKNIPSNGKIFLNCETTSYQKAPTTTHSYGRYNYDYNDHGYPIVDETIKLTTVKLFCEDGKLTFSGNDNIPKKSNYGSTLKCENELSFYQVQSEYCNNQAIAFGLNIKKSPVVVAEICYNFNSMKIDYLHYTTGKRSSLLSRQIDHNPSSGNMSEMIDGNKFTFDQQYKFDIQIENNLTTHKNLVKLISYELSELVASTSFSNMYKNLIPNNKLPLVPWWKPLKDGNWMIYEQLLKIHTRDQNFSVFTGISHKARYPEKFLCSVDADITYEINSEVNNIPQYIWSYVKMRNDTSNEHDIVVIGVNTPFFDGSTLFCTDKCSDITWLAELELTRKMQAFGYIYCCDPDQVRTILDGFPNESVIVS